MKKKTSNVSKKKPQKKKSKVYKVNKKTKKYIKIKSSLNGKIIKIKKTYNKYLSKNKKGGGNINLEKVLGFLLKTKDKISLKTILLSQLHDTLDYGEQAFSRYNMLLETLNSLQSDSLFSGLNFNNLKTGETEKDWSTPSHLFNCVNGNFALLDLVTFTAKSCCCDIIYNTEEVDENRVENKTIDHLKTHLDTLNNSFFKNSLTINKVAEPGNSNNQNMVTNTFDLNINTTSIPTSLESSMNIIKNRFAGNYNETIPVKYDSRTGLYNSLASLVSQEPNLPEYDSLGSRPAQPALRQSYKSATPPPGHGSGYGPGGRYMGRGGPSQYEIAGNDSAVSYSGAPRSPPIGAPEYDNNGNPIYAGKSGHQTVAPFYQELPTHLTPEIDDE
jgi:hypothetical protein